MCFIKNTATFNNDIKAAGVIRRPIFMANFYAFFPVKLTAIISSGKLY
jgi:hypothetical protein